VNGKVELTNHQQSKIRQEVSQDYEVFRTHPGKHCNATVQKTAIRGLAFVLWTTMMSHIISFVFQESINLLLLLLLLFVNTFMQGIYKNNLNQSMSLEYIMILWLQFMMQYYFKQYMVCTFTSVLSKICAQCPIWLFTLAS